MTWLVAFLLHSTLWCGLAWLLTRVYSRLQPRTRETIWQTAILASLLTPTLHTLTAGSASLWQLPLPATLPSATEAAHAELESREHFAAVEHAAPANIMAETHEPRVGEGWVGVIGAIWLVGSGLLLLRYGYALATLHGRLGPRHPVCEDRAGATIVTLSKQAGLRTTPTLTTSDRLASPIALGVAGAREVCLPTRALDELDDGQLHVLLGHELAHHRRLDVVRLGALNVLQAVFFFQPLFRLASRALRSAAEEQCDDWAATQLEDRLALASCLTEVARWLSLRPQRLPAPGMATTCSHLRRRVERLLTDAPRPRLQRWGQLGLALTVLTLTACVAPGVRSAGEASHEGEREAQVEHGEHRESAEHRESSNEHR